MRSASKGKDPVSTLRLPIPIRNAVDAHAEANDLGRSAVIREAITEYLDRRGIEVGAA